MLMDWLGDVRYRFRALFRRAAMERELDDELRFHLEREAEKLVRRGLSPDEAMRQARIAFGGVDRFKDESREARGVAPLETIAHDLRYAARRLRLSPGFTIAVVLTLGLGLGANAAMFGVIDRLLFRAPPFLHAADDVHRVYLGRIEQGSEFVESTLEYTRYLDLRRWTTAFAQAAAISSRRLAVGEGQDAREMSVSIVSASFWDLFDARPALGRYFTAREDSVPAGAPVFVISHALWQSRFGGRADVLGLPLRVGAVSGTIIGVAPRGFVGIPDEGPPDVFMPATTFAASAARGSDPTNYYTRYNWGWMEMLVRRKPGVSVEAATADLTSAYQRSWQAERDLGSRLPSPEVARPRAIAAAVSRDRGPKASQVSRVATWVGGVAAIVLLIACANVANLLLARALRRRREIALRLALGAGRGRLLSQLLTESVLLAALGGAAGLLAAQWGATILGRYFLPEGVDARVMGDARTLSFAGAMMVVVGLLTGLVPALQAGRADVAGSLKSGAREGVYQRSRARTALLVFQAALSVVLLVGAGLFVRSLENVRAVRLGYDVDPLLVVRPNARGTSFTMEEQLRLARELEAEARSMPSVASATRAVSVPFADTWGQGFSVPGVDSVRRFGRFTVQAASPDHFRTMGTRILRGRAIDVGDRAGAPLVAVVSDGMARTLWPGKDAIGQCMKVSFGEEKPPCTTVVGIAENIKQSDLDEDERLQYYLAFDQLASPNGITLFVRMREGDASRYADLVRRQLQRLMPGASYVMVTPLHDIIDPQLRSWRLGATMFAAFGALALLVAAVGLYGVISYDVAQRTRDLGVRMALGARGADVVRLVLGQGIGIAAVGIAIGIAISLAVGRWVAPLLFGASPRDPLVFAAVTTMLLLVAAAASVLPARRAARVDPSVTLRGE